MNSASLIRACGQQPSGFAGVFRRVALAAAVVITLGASGFAQNATVGTIQGRVQNGTNGLYLKNVRIVVQGTSQDTLTDEFGEYSLTSVPAGSATIKAVYPGLEQKIANVNVQAGQAAVQDFVLTNAQFTQEDVIKLDQFVVAAARDTNAASIATSEQRFAPNIKNVVSSDAFGDVTEGNVGEFVKNLPGVSVDYVAADVRTINVRGLNSNFTTISVDGARVASAASGTTTRTVELEQLSINNVARVDLTKEPTPDAPADSLGGAINLVSRSAFEQSKTVFNYKAYLSVNSEDLKIYSKSPGPGVRSTYKGLPGAEFNYIAPLSKTFGIAINGLSSNQFNEQHRSNPSWLYTTAGATAAAPLLQSYATQDGPKVTYRDSIGAKVDWKFAPGHVLSATYQFNYYKNFFGNRNVNWNVGSTSVPTPATGTALTFGPTFTYGATGRGTVTQGSSFRDKLGNTNVVLVNYNYKGRDWEILGGANWSQSRSDYQDLANGHWATSNTSLQGVSRVLFDGITYPHPNGFSALTTGAVPVDYTTLSNYRLTTLRTQPLHALDIVTGYNLSAKRDLNFLPFEASLKIGGDVREQYRDIRKYQSDITFVGADGVANTADDSAAPYLDTNYIGQEHYWGFPPIQWADPFALATKYQTNPNYFAQTLAQQTGALRFQIANSQKLTEKVSSAYAQLEFKGLKNRLRVVTGVRLEKTTDTGVGALYNPRAAFDASGVRLPAAGAVGSVAETQLTRIERGYRVSKSYNGSYPSVNGTFNFTDNLLLRFSYAKTLGRPDLGNILPSVRINDTASADNTDGLGTVPANTIIATNPGLKPWTGDNYDLAMEYYFPDGGLIAVGGFRKNLADFFSTDTHALTAADAADFGVDSAYLTWPTTMQFQQLINGGAAHITGGEFNFAHSLNMLPWWGKYLNFTANATLLHLQGNSGTQFANFIPKMANVGLTLSKKPIMIMVKVQYRGQERQTSNTTSPNSYDWYAARTTIDLTSEYQVSKHATVFASARNITNVPQNYLRYSTANPLYSQFYRAEEYGIQWAIGLRGSF